MLNLKIYAIPSGEAACLVSVVTYERRVTGLLGLAVGTLFPALTVSIVSPPTEDVARAFFLALTGASSFASIGLMTLWIFATRERRKMLDDIKARPAQLLRQVA